MKLLFFFYFHMKKSIYGRFSALFLQKHHVFPCVLMGKPDVFFFSLYIHLFYHVETAIWD